MDISKARTSGLVLVASLSLLVGCAKAHAAKTAQVAFTSAKAPRAGLNLDDDLRRLCNIRFDNDVSPPQFDFDEAALSRGDRDLLAQVATCMTTGPLKGRRLGLVGRADPRGETEYNMALGGNRAEAVRDYLVWLGVDSRAVDETSRGELDAEGKDEDGWRRDRRVDLVLQADTQAHLSRESGDTFGMARHATP